MYDFNFPLCTKHEKTVSEQLEHLQSEVIETMHAWYTGESVYDVGTELLDVIHAAETTLRMLNFTNYELNDLKDRVIQKNAERGYYD